ncbi:MAG: hypothetical protein OH319_01980 [Candidatus Parvarchaeota archaeon]|nr:hypothetical protein [Candidatus Jingweiarchaeum tengchongense]MCW1298139.1 hypothetical protein [Candidatus Jingweiarchaeum tengchongense]MCW1299938.1 hypothetical protein [Candidatus Jingweiarchaeum tengchongense]MCW1305077.1 hypothetical protein [Candidatus Jingweiarchaeum tengchongense]MCW1305560.1 hypothetical protein [Candidatus Jingweiarchaeum tengchongense]
MVKKSKLETLLDEALEKDTLGKWSVYHAITGKEWWGSKLGLGEIHPVKITKKNMDKVYLVIKKMQRNKYYYDPTNPDNILSRYYESTFENIDKAFLEGDLKKFKAAVEDLLLKIVLD